MSEKRAGGLMALNNARNVPKLGIELNIKIGRLLSLYIAGIPALYFLSLFFTVLGNSLRPLLIGFTIAFFLTVTYAVKEYGVLSLYSIFLYTSVFFTYTLVFLEAIFSEEKYNFLEYTYPASITFSNEVGVIFLTAAFLEMYTMHVVYCLSKKTTSGILSYGAKQHPIYIQVGMLIMTIFFIPALIKIIIELKYIMANGYRSVFLGYNGINYPIWTSGAIAFFTAGYFLSLAGNPDKKQFLKITVLYGIVSSLNALRGQRAGLISFLIISIYWCTKKYGVIVKARRMIGLGIVLIVLIVGLNLLRNSYGTESSLQEVTIQLVMDKLVGSSGSSFVPLYVMKGDLTYRCYPFIFSPLLTPINSLLYGNAQSVSAVQRTNDISDVITYQANSSLYLNGGGVGGSFLAEAYDCGGFLGVIFWSAILASLIKFIDTSHLNVKSRYIPILYAVLSSIPLMPRSRLFGFMGSYLPLLIAYAVMFVLGLMVSREYRERLGNRIKHINNTR